MKKKDKRTIVKKKVEREIMLDEFGREDLGSVKGSFFNRPVSTIGFVIFLAGPIIGGMTESTFLGGTLFIIGAIIGSYGMSKSL
jgi:hypothetical protein